MLRDLRGRSRGFVAVVFVLLFWLLYTAYQMLAVYWSDLEILVIVAVVPAAIMTIKALVRYLAAMSREEVHDEGLD